MDFVNLLNWINAQKYFQFHFRAESIIDLKSDLFILSSSVTFPHIDDASAGSLEWDNVSIVQNHWKLKEKLTRLFSLCPMHQLADCDRFR